jgi:hypothetical protein
MSSFGGPGAGPVIAGSSSEADFPGFLDEDFAENFFSESNGADDLQGLRPSGDKVFLGSDHLDDMVIYPDSPGSYHDSSSESAVSTKRATSLSASGKTPITTGDVTNENMSYGSTEWTPPGFTGMDADESVFDFSRGSDDTLYKIHEQFDQSFMDRSFDFERASSSPGATSTDHLPIATTHEKQSLVSTLAFQHDIQSKVLT